MRDVQIPFRVIAIPISVLVALVPLTSCGLEEASAPVAESVSAIRGPRAWADETWLAPNLGSPDLLSLFSQPELWPIARSRVHVVQLYAPQITAESPAECFHCRGNLKQALLDVDAYAKLRGFGIDLAVETPLLKAEYPCGGQAASAQVRSNIDYALHTMNLVKANGGVVSRLVFDEPFFAGVRTDLVPGCRLGVPDTVAIVRDAIKTLRPVVQVGLVEPYPAVSAAQLASYLDMLVQSDARPAFFHLDVDDAILPPNWLSELNSLRQHAAALGIPFGVLYAPVVAATSQAFYVRALSQVTRYAQLGRQEHAVFQSFALIAPPQDPSQLFPVNLPENDPNAFSLTRLILEGTNTLSALLPAWTPPPTPGFRLAAGFSDEAGFYVPTTGDTLLVGDLNGDGRDDVVARGHAGLFAQLSQGTTFGPRIQVSGAFSDAAGWSDPARARSLRLADVDHDGQLDVVGYEGARGLVVARGELVATPGGPAPSFGSAQARGIFGAGNDPGSLGWADVTGDGLGDFIMRGPSGLLVAAALDRNVYAPAALATPDFAPAGGWTDERYARIAYGDVNLDGCADVAARGVQGAYVALSDCRAVKFRPAALATDFFTDARGFGKRQYATSFQLGDVNRDSCADLIMRGGAGAWVKVSDCAGKYPFPEQLLTNFFADSVGFDASIYIDTFRVGDPAGTGRVAAIQRGGAGYYTVY